MLQKSSCKENIFIVEFLFIAFSLLSKTQIPGSDWLGVFAFLFVFISFFSFVFRFFVIFYFFPSGLAVVSQRTYMVIS